MTIQKFDMSDLEVNLNLTSECNLGCSFCFAMDFLRATSRLKLISEENLEYFIEALKRDNVRYVNLIGGEPSIHPNAADIVDRVYPLVTELGFSTNLLWPERFRRDVERVKDKVRFEVTLLSPQEYKEGQWDQVLESMDVLRGSDVSLGLAITNPQFDYENHIRLAEKYGFKLRWSLAEPTYGRNNQFAYDDLSRLPEFRKRIMQFLYECSDKGIDTWLDLAVPRCLFNEEDLELFRGKSHDVQFICPPFFDVGTDLRYWESFTLCEQYAGDLRQAGGLLAACHDLDCRYGLLDRKAVFQECSECGYLPDTCSGGPRVLKVQRDK